MKKIYLISLLTGTLVACNGGSSGNSPTPSPTPATVSFAYFTNFGGNSYTQCGVSANGIEISTCTTIKPTGSNALTYPMGIAFNESYAYITNSANSGGYTQCHVNSIGIIETNTCTRVIPQTNNGELSYAIWVAFNGNYVYFDSSNGGSGEPYVNWQNNYTQCQIGANGIVNPNSCTTVTPTGIGALNWPYLFAFNTLNGNYAYFPNMNSSNYTQCSVGENGIESASCAIVTPTGNSALSNPSAIAFNGSYAYITNLNNYTGGSFTQCAVRENGVIDSSTCNTLTLTGTNTLSSPYGIAFKGNYAYFVNGDNNSFTQCTVGNNGIEINTCITKTPTGFGALNYPIGLAFN